jgi:hypothetical protein
LSTGIALEIRKIARLPLFREGTQTSSGARHNLRFVGSLAPELDLPINLRHESCILQTGDPGPGARQQHLDLSSFF